MKVKKPKQTHSVRRINRIAELSQARSYLEIGVSKGRTFHALDFSRKAAVDPVFRFSTEEYRRHGIHFFEITSDEYFVKNTASEKFDIIFLDGLHRFQQTLRDFCNSLACAHDHTVWLIDDVLPCDEHSACPDERECLRRRREAGDPSKKWHGDIYKLMFTIHDFFPVFSYVTPHTDGNPQSIVWKAPRQNFSPVFDNLETIERLSYAELLERTSVLNLCTEDEAFQTLKASLDARQ